MTAIKLGLDILTHEKSPKSDQQKIGESFALFSICVLGECGEWLRATIEGFDCVSFSARCTLELLTRIGIDFFESHTKLAGNHGVSNKMKNNQKASSKKLARVSSCLVLAFWGMERMTGSYSWRIWLCELLCDGYSWTACQNSYRFFFREPHEAGKKPLCFKTKVKKITKKRQTKNWREFRLV